jgi:hypothetical protein
MTFITYGFRVSVVSDVREGVRDFRINFALLRVVSNVLSKNVTKDVSKSEKALSEVTQYPSDSEHFMV